MILNSFNASVTGASATALLAIGDIFGDAEHLAGLNTQKLLALAVILSWLIVIYQNRKSEKDRLSERKTHEAAISGLAAHHNDSVITMNVERKEFREALVDLVTNNTHAMTKVVEAVKGLHEHCLSTRR